MKKAIATTAAAQNKGNGTGTPTNTPTRQKYKPDQVIDAIQRAHGIATVAAKVLGCTRGVIYLYMERYPEIKEACTEARNATVDYAENKQIQALRRGERWAIENWLFYSKEGRARGWLRRAAHAQDQGILNAIQIVMPDNARGDAIVQQPTVTIETVEADLRRMKKVSVMIGSDGSPKGDATDWLFAEEQEGGGA